MVSSCKFSFGHHPAIEICYARQANKQLASALPGHFRHIESNAEPVAETSTPRMRNHETIAVLDGMDIDGGIADGDD
jgi:hypothetical protein